MADRVFPFRLWPTATSIAATAAITSGVIDARRLSGLDSLELTLAGSAPDLQVIMQTGSYDGTTFSPTNEIEVVASTATEFTTDTGTHHISLPPLLGAYVKFRLVGTASNHATDTTVVGIAYGREAS